MSFKLPLCLDALKLWNPLPTDPHAEAPGLAGSAEAPGQPGSADSERPAATCADPGGKARAFIF